MPIRTLSDRTIVYGGRAATTQQTNLCPFFHSCNLAFHPYSLPNHRWNSAMSVSITITALYRSSTTSMIAEPVFCWRQ